MNRYLELKTKHAFQFMRKVDQPDSNIPFNNDSFIEQQKYLEKYSVIETIYEAFEEIFEEIYPPFRDKTKLIDIREFLLKHYEEIKKHVETTLSNNNEKADIRNAAMQIIVKLKEQEQNTPKPKAETGEIE